MKRLLSAMDVSELLQMTTNQICRLARDGKIPVVGLPAKNAGFAFDEDDIEKWIKSHKRPGIDGPATTNDLVYLACPYSHPDVDVRELRFFKANHYAAKLMEAGILVFSPISHTHPIAEAGDLPKGWDFWERYDRAYLSICRALVVLTLDGWNESKGVQAEIKIMDELRRPVWCLQEHNADNLQMTIKVLGGNVL